MLDIYNPSEVDLFANQQQIDDAYHTFFEVMIGGRKFVLPLQRQQLAKVAYLQAARDNCIFCGGKAHVVGKITLPEMLHSEAYFALYAVCKECFERKGPDQTKREAQYGLQL